MRHRHLLASVLVAAVGLTTATVVVPLLATPAGAASYRASGSILKPAPGGNPAVDAEFVLRCPALPSQQGLDAFVFRLPPEYAVAGTTITVTGTAPAGLYDLAAYVYKANCAYDRSVTTGVNLSFPLAAGDTWIEVWTSLGSDVAIELEASNPAVPSPTATLVNEDGTRRTYSGTPNDPLFLQDGAGDLFFAGQWGMRKVRAPEAWREPRATGAGIRVAVLDSGLDLGHPDFACADKVELVPGADPDNDGRTVPQDDVEGHGTHVAGIIGACTNNGTGVVGVAPDATLLPIQVLSAASDMVTLATALRTAADNGAHVVNLSLGGGLAPGGIFQLPASGSAAAYAGLFADVDAAVDYAVSKGVVVVAAAGNETSPLCGYPAIANDIVCVGSSDPRDANSWYGNFPVKLGSGSPVGAALLAPGGTGTQLCDFSSEEILSTYSRSVDAAEGNCDTYSGYASMFGTSMASPLVAGAAALVYDRLGGTRSPATAAKVVEALLETAVDLYAPGYDPASGAGRLDVLAAVRYWGAAPLTNPTVEPVAKRTVLTLTNDVPATVQYGDALPLAARLVDEAGVPVVGETVTFQLLGPSGFREASALTGPDGVATQSLLASTEPGEYRVAVGYSGKADVYEGSVASQPIAVVREDTALSLVVSGTGSKRTLTVTLAESDDAARRVAGVTVTFWADGVEVGSMVTDATGTATFSPKNAKAYEARFAGDPFYAGSSDTA